MCYLVHFKRGHVFPATNETKFVFKDEDSKDYYVKQMSRDPNWTISEHGRVEFNKMGIMQYIQEE